jgi:hypothetical protein
MTINKILKGLTALAFFMILICGAALDEAEHYGVLLGIILFCTLWCFLFCKAWENGYLDD